MKNKAVIATLALICIASVACNVYQYNKLNTSRQQLADAQAQLDNITSDYTDLDAQITAMQEEIDSLNTSISDKQSEIDSLTQENNDLMSRVSVEDGVEDEADAEVEEPTDSIVAVEPSESDKDVVDASTPNPNDLGIGTFTYKDGYWEDEWGLKLTYVNGHWEDEYGGRLIMSEEDMDYSHVENNGEGREWSEEYLEMLQSIQWE